MVNDSVAPQPRSDAAAHTPNWDADLFGGSSSSTSNRFTDTNSNHGGKLAEFPGAAPAPPESGSDVGTGGGGGGGKLNPFAGPPETPSLARPSSGEETEAGGKLRPNGGSDRIESLVAQFGAGDLEVGGKLNPNGGVGDVESLTAHLSPTELQSMVNQLTSTETEGGGKLKPYGGLLDNVSPSTIADLIDGPGGGKLNPNAGSETDETRPGGGKLNPLGGSFAHLLGPDGKFEVGGKLNDGGGKLHPHGGWDIPQESHHAHDTTNPSHSSVDGHVPIRPDSVISASDAVHNGDFDALKKSLEKAFEENGVDAKKFNAFGKKLAEKMKGQGYNVNSGDGVLTVHREGDPHGVEFKMDAHLDFATGRIRGDAQAQTYDHVTKANVDRDPSEVLSGRSSDQPRHERTEAVARSENDNVREMNAHRLDSRLNRLMKPAPGQRRHSS